MSTLIGRRGGGGGGRGHHGGGGRGGRRFFGGWGGGGWDGWPWPYMYQYPWPQAYVQPYAVVQPDPGVVMGAVASASAPAAVAVLAPGAAGLACELDLDPDLRLHVSIVVDGIRHETSVDLSGILSGLAEKASARPHVDLATQATRAVQSAGALLVGALYEQHVGEITAGFWDSLKGAVTAAASPVTWFNGQVAKVVKAVPGMKEAVTAAATAAATAYGGPAAGMAASNLTGPALDKLAETDGDPTRMFESAKVEAAQQSGGDPKVTQAIGHAQKAITQTAAAYTLKALLHSADAGHRDSARRLGEIQRAAQAGDPASMRAMQIVAEIQRLSSVTAAPGTSVGFSGGAGLGELRDLALSSAAQTRATHGFGEAVVFVVSPRHGQFSVPFGSRTEAIHYARHVDPRSMTYIATVDVSDPSSPFLLTERSFREPVATTSPGGAANSTVSGGAFLPFLAGAATGALGGYAMTNADWARRLRDGSARGADIYDDDRLIYAAARPATPR